MRGACPNLPTLPYRGITLPKDSETFRILETRLSAAFSAPLHLPRSALLARALGFAVSRTHTKLASPPAPAYCREPHALCAGQTTVYQLTRAHLGPGLLVCYFLLVTEETLFRRMRHLCPMTWQYDVRQHGKNTKDAKPESQNRQAEKRKIAPLAFCQRTVAFGLLA